MKSDLEGLFDIYMCDVGLIVKAIFEDLLRKKGLTNFNFDDDCDAAMICFSSSGRLSFIIIQRRQFDNEDNDNDDDNDEDTE